MAQVKIQPTEARVRWDAHTHAPAEVAWNGRRLRVAHVERVRDERAAYPRDGGPRVSFVVDAVDGARAAVVFDGRRRRWYVEALDPAA
jgi:hypothetical protein